MGFGIEWDSRCLERVFLPLIFGHHWNPLRTRLWAIKKNKLCCFHWCKSKQRTAKIWEFTGPEHIPLNKTRNQLVWESLREFKLGFFRRKVSSLTSCKRRFGFLIPALIFPAGFDFLAHLFLNIWGFFWCISSPPVLLFQPCFQETTAVLGLLSPFLGWSHF